MWIKDTEIFDLKPSKLDLITQLVAPVADAELSKVICVRVLEKP